MIHALLLVALGTGALVRATAGQDPASAPVPAPAQEPAEGGEAAQEAGQPPTGAPAQTGAEPDPALQEDAQAGAPPASDPAEGGAAPRSRLVPVNAVQLIVNEECITTTDVLRKTLQQRNTVSSEEELARLSAQIAGDQISDLLKSQAGRDLGFQDEMVQALVRDELEAKRERAGSITQLARELELQSLDSAQLKEATEAYIFRQLWEGSVNGRYAGPGGRPYADRYVRPGLLRFEFLRQGPQLELPATIRVEEMILAPGRGESVDSARQRGLLVRARLLKGEDFAELNAQFGLPDRDVEVPPMEETALLRVPELTDFIRDAAEGDISELLPIRREGQVAGFRILRFVERREAVVKDFLDRQFQDQLTRLIRTSRDTYRERKALSGLMEAAYIWPPEFVGRVAQRESSAAEVEGATGR